MCACLFVYLWLCVGKCMHIRTRVCARIRVCVCVCVCSMHVYMYFVCVFVCVCVYACMCVSSAPVLNGMVSIAEVGCPLLK